MLVIPTQIKYVALKIDYSPEFFIKIGEFLDKKYYEIKKDNIRYREILYLKYENNETREMKNGDYLLFAEDNHAIWAYVEKEVFDKTYLILKEEEK